MTRTLFAATLAIACGAALARTAHADDVVAYQAEGDAPASAADARTMALDEAFANAVTTALSELVTPELRTARKGDLDREVIGHARLWVPKFSVTKDETVEDRRELTVSVRVDRDKLRARLDELGIATKDLTAANPPGGDGAAPLARTVTVLLRMQSPAGIQATYGAEANAELPGAIALNNLLRGQGFMVRKAPASGSAGGALDEAGATSLALAAKADHYAVADVTVGAPVAVRGKPGTASLVTASIKLVEASGSKMVGQGNATAASLGDAYAVARALTLAFADVFPPQPLKLGQAGAFAGDDTPIAESGVALVRLPARTPLATVLAAQKYLAGAKGVKSATLRRLSPNGWVIGVVTGESLESVARMAKKSLGGDATPTVKIAHDVVEVTPGSP